MHACTHLNFLASRPLQSSSFPSGFIVRRSPRGIRPLTPRTTGNEDGEIRYRLHRYHALQMKRYFARAPMAARWQRIYVYRIYNNTEETDKQCLVFKWKYSSYRRAGLPYYRHGTLYRVLPSSNFDPGYLRPNTEKPNVIRSISSEITHPRFFAARLAPGIDAKSGKMHRDAA